MHAQAGGGLLPRNHIDLREIMDYLDRDAPFTLAVRTNADLTVGAGFHLQAANLETEAGQRALDMIKQYCDDTNMDAVLQRIAVDAWACGNAFVTVTDAGLLAEIDPGTIVNIQCDANEEPISYTQYSDPQYGGSGEYTTIPADEILHFTWQKSGGTGGFGVGLGKINAQVGKGYTTHKGRTIYRASPFKQRELASDITSKMLYAGAPRHSVTTSSTVSQGKQILDALESMEPLDHIVTNEDVKIDQVSLSLSNRFDAIFSQIDDTAVMATMSPMLNILRAHETSYAAIKQSYASQYPMIDTMQRAIKRFIEQNVFRPYLEQHGYQWHEVRVSIAFGTEKQLDTERIDMIIDMLTHPMFEDRFNPDDILDMMRDAGIPLQDTNPDDPKVLARIAARRDAEMSMARALGINEPTRDTNSTYDRAVRKMAKRNTWSVRAL